MTATKDPANFWGIPKVIISLSAVSFFLAFNYFILKALKETLLVTAPDAGAEAIPFVKMWLLFPISVLFLAAFAWLATRISLKFAVSGMILFFLLCYAIFAFILYPMRETLHLHQLAEEIQHSLPAGWRGFSAVVRYWSYSLFFVAAECWCTMIYSVVFWGYANAVIKLGDAKKYYAYLTLAGTIAALIAGPLTIFLTGETLASWLPNEINRWSVAFYSLTAAVLVSGILGLSIFLKSCPSVETFKQEGQTPPLLHSFLRIFRSRYLLTLAGICLSYNLLINLTDVVWKNEVLKIHPDPGEFTSYLSHVTLITGIVSTFFTLFVCRQSLQKYGWTKTALITPILALATGGIFFIAIYGQLYDLLPATLSAAAFLGSIHICISSGAKYTLFEPTKEMAFIPLSNEEKLHGKAAIDGVGARLGKTASSLIYQTLLLILPSISACTPFVGLLMIAGLALCITFIVSLGSQMEGEKVPSL